MAKYNNDYCDFWEFSTKEERQAVFQYITWEANMMQRRLAGLE
ncbi:hypothetical protein [Fructobacillus apis]|nr:hypothetical protein [Fructobacillus apis]